MPPRAVWKMRPSGAGALPLDVGTEQRDESARYPSVRGQGPVRRPAAATSPCQVVSRTMWCTGPTAVPPASPTSRITVSGTTTCCCTSSAGPSPSTPTALARSPAPTARSSAATARPLSPGNQPASQLRRDHPVARLASPNTATPIRKTRLRPSRSPRLPAIVRTPAGWLGVTRSLCCSRGSINRHEPVPF